VILSDLRYLLSHWVPLEYVSSLLGLSVSFSKSVVQSMGMFPKEEGSLNIDETKIFIPLNFTPRIKKYE